MNENTSMKKKWYLQTWFIALLVAFWPMVIPPIIGVFFMVLQHKRQRELESKYGNIDSLSTTIEQKTIELENLREKSEKEKTAALQQAERIRSELKSKKAELEKEISEAKDELNLLSTQVLVRNYTLADYESLTSEECKDRLSVLKTKEQQMIQDGKAVLVDSDEGKKIINNVTKQILRCFNSECDNALLNLSVKSVDSARGKIQKSFESLNKIFAIDGIALSTELLESKLEGLNLVYTYELKREQEREQQKAIKEQMLEEEKVRREIEREKAKIEKDQSQVSSEINRLIKYLQKTQNDTEKELYLDKIKELEARLKQLEEDKATVVEREANARAGFVYVISNIGSFGDDVYKIGMTRRLEPMDRIKELSSASVPFDFDVHAMIFSNDAPELENSLHQHFEKQSVNKVNPRKEFFKVKLDEIERHVKENFNSTTEFIHTALALQYRQSLELSQTQA